MSRLLSLWRQSEDQLGAATILYQAASLNLRSAIEVRISGALPLREDGLAEALAASTAEADRWDAAVGEMRDIRRRVVESARVSLGLCEVCGSEDARWIDAAATRFCPRHELDFEREQEDAAHASDEAAAALSWGER